MDFDPLPTPNPDDWLANHPEPGQTFEDFIASGPNKPDAQRRTIHIHPLGHFGADSPPLGLLEEFARVFGEASLHERATAFSFAV